MGKTKTVLVGEEPKVKKEVKKPEKVHVSGLKGGQRIKAMESELPPVVQTPSDSEVKAESETKIKKVKIRGKKYKEAKAKIDRAKFYKLEDALKIVKEITYTKFNSTLELHIVVKKKGISVNAEMPYSAGKEKRIEVANDETIKKLQEGKIDFDLLLATGEFMPKLVPFAKLLGPKGLMPNPKNQTLIKSEKEISKFSAKTLRVKTEKEAPLIHTVVGKVDQKDIELLENIKAIFSAIGEKQIVRAYLSATMSPSVKLLIG